MIVRWRCSCRDCDWRSEWRTIRGPWDRLKARADGFEHDSSGHTTRIDTHMIAESRHD